MKHLVTGLMAIALGFALSGSAQAGLLSSALTFDGVEDIIEDVSRATIIDNNTNDILDTGDNIVGVIALEKFNGANITGQIFGIFSVTLTTPFVTGSGALGFNHVATPDSIPVDLPGSLDDTGLSIEEILTRNGLAPLGFTFDDSEFFAIVEHNSGVSPIAGNPTPLSVINSMTSANSWQLAAIGGLDGVDDFFQTRIVSTAADDIGDGSLPLTISEIRADDNSVQVLNERAVFTVEYHTLGSGTVFLPLSLTRFDAGSGSGDITIEPNSSVSTSAPGTSNSDVVDRATFRVNATPEPSSLALLGLGGALLGGMGYRRRKKATQA